MVRTSLRFWSRRHALAAIGSAGLAAIVGACQASPAPTAAPAKPTAPAGGQASGTTAPAPSTAAPVAATKPAASGRAVSIKYQQRDHQVEDFVRKTYGPQFEKETGTKVIIEDIPSAEYFQKIPVLSAANQLGDLIFGWTYPWLPNWASKNMLRPIDDYVAQDRFDLSQFYRGVIDACRLESKLYALPTVAHAGSTNIFFNKTMLKAAGIKPPDAESPNDVWKWDDILTAAKALTKDTNGDGKPDVWGWLPSRDFTLWTMVNLRAFGTDIVAPDGKTSPAGDEQGKRAYRYYYDLIYQHKVTPGPTDLTQGIGLAQLFAAEKLAMFQEATFLVTTLEPIVNKKFEWGVFIMPPGPAGTRGATVFGNTTSITTQAKEPEAAFAFLKYITTHEVGVQKLLMQSGSPGARPDVFQDPRLVTPYPWFRVGHKAMEEAKAPNLPANYRTPEIFSAVPQVESEIWLDKVKPEEGATKVQTTIDAVLKQPR